MGLDGEKGGPRVRRKAADWVPASRWAGPPIPRSRGEECPPVAFRPAPSALEISIAGHRRGIPGYPPPAPAAGWTPIPSLGGGAFEASGCRRGARVGHGARRAAHGRLGHGERDDPTTRRGGGERSGSENGRKITGRKIKQKNAPWGRGQSFCVHPKGSNRFAASRGGNNPNGGETNPLKCTAPPPDSDHDP